MKLFTIILLVCIGTFAVFVTMAWYRIHPCLEFRRYQGTCGGTMYCTVYDMDFNCITWSFDDAHPCTVTECTRRK